MTSPAPAGPSRRTVLAGGVAAVGSAAVTGVAARPAFAAPPPDDPFTLGVASGDPRPDGVTLWTRLAPDPLAADGGMAPRDVLVVWQVAEDESFADPVRSGSVRATAGEAHSVHVDVTGLDPDRVYFYRFRAGRYLSRTGRTRTFPAPGAAVRSLRFATFSCQNLPVGHFVAYRHAAQQDLDVVLHLGDYIYEAAGPASPPAGPDRRHAPFETVDTLEGYRIRHAQYRTDPDLQDAHAAFPFVVVPDDHEVVNNQNESTRAARRAAAYQAYWEHMPLRASARPSGSSIPLFRSLDYGRLATFDMLDTRQYRSVQLPGPTFQALPPEAFDPTRTILGAEQEQWLFDRLSGSGASWNLLAQQVYLAALDMEPGPVEAYNTDKWDGYPVARERLTRFLHGAAVPNPVVLAGDVHAAMVNDVTLSYGDRPVVASELLGSSVTSGKGNNALFEAALPENPEMLFYNGRQRGYLTCEVTPDALRGDLWFADDVLDRASAVRRQASYVVLDGVRGALEV
ncbi:alkaline phosphatase D family protein [Aquipuribacter sp. SD81]|uniref:alkaline phosphatase D family protein n=1 Tax=Aquipuribacter sp. SD81 TaxID=3127703 RepID=UPI003017A58E